MFVIFQDETDDDEEEDEDFQGKTAMALSSAYES
jgi:hypothetical protein